MIAPLAPYTSTPARRPVPLMRFGKKFHSLREANDLFQSELRERGITADTLWNDWGVWFITSSYNYLSVWMNPKKNKHFDKAAFIDWLGQRMPRYKARMMEGETRPDAWISVGEQTYCCRNHCEGCKLTADPDTGIGRISKKRRSWTA